MDQEQELRKFKWLMGGAVVFFISAFYAYGELKYLVLGKTAEARVTRTLKFKDARLKGPGVEMLAVEYQFVEASGTPRGERDNVALDWPIPENGVISVQYLTGVANSSRLVGNRNLFSVFVFIAALGGVIFFVVKLWRDASEAVHGSQTGKRR